MTSINRWHRTVYHNIEIIDEWQSRVEIEYYSRWVKIMFSAEIVALGLSFDAAEELAVSRKHTMRYGSLNATPSTINLQCNVSKSANALSTRRLVITLRSTSLVSFQHFFQRIGWHKAEQHPAEWLTTR